MMKQIRGYRTLLQRQIKVSCFPCVPSLLFFSTPPLTNDQESFNHYYLKTIFFQRVACWAVRSLNIPTWDPHRHFKVKESESELILLYSLFLLTTLPSDKHLHIILTSNFLPYQIGLHIPSTI